MGENRYFSVVCLFVEMVITRLNIVSYLIFMQTIASTIATYLQGVNLTNRYLRNYYFHLISKGFETTHGRLDIDRSHILIFDYLHGWRNRGGPGGIFPSGPH